MKKQKLTLGMLAMSILLSFSACQKDDVIEPEIQNTTLEQNAVANYTTDFVNLENPTILGATDKTEFSIKYEKRADSQERTLADVLKRLNLNERQSRAAKEFVHQYSGCAEKHRAKIIEIHQQLVKRANAIREEYLKAYKEGKLTKRELEHKLHALKANLKMHINTNKQAHEHFQMIRKCRTELFRNIASVLNPEQLQKFKHWVNTLR